MQGFRENQRIARKQPNAENEDVYNPLWPLSIPALPALLPFFFSDPSTGPKSWLHASVFGFGIGHPTDGHPARLNVV
jgi:hypothetical protein